jgi:2-keto-3-deoxy-L-rhamnonate aldolase RhmA
VKSAQILREKINSNKLTLGVLCTYHFWFDLIEIAWRAGLDYLIIDTEHMAPSDQLLSEACPLGRLIDFPVLIRPAETEAHLVRLAADKGPCGLLLPYVTSAATLDEARHGLYMPPRGKRRPGGPGNRWVSSYDYTSWRDEQENDFIILPQIESAEGLKNAREIASHQLTTAVAIGPYDLSASLGVCWKPEDPKLQAAIQQIRDAGRAAGKNMWMIGDGPTLIKRGYTFICFAEPVSLMEATIKNQVSAMRSGQRRDDGEPLEQPLY